jgi:hypothetical protein
MIVNIQKNIYNDFSLQVFNEDNYNIKSIKNFEIESDISLIDTENSTSTMFLIKNIKVNKSYINKVELIINSNYT